MRKIMFAMVLAAGAMAFAAEQKYVDPNPFAGYGEAMKSTSEHPLAVNWSQQNDAAIAAATDEDVLAAFVEDAESAKALLAGLKPAYASDPLLLTQISAVTQWVMMPEPCWLCFWKPSPAAGRKVWVAALKTKILQSTDEYVQTFCRQQLDLCK